MRSQSRELFRAALGTRAGIQINQTTWDLVKSFLDRYAKAGYADGGNRQLGLPHQCDTHCTLSLLTSQSRVTTKGNHHRKFLQ